MKWEYKTLKLSISGMVTYKLDETQLDEDMTALGEQGWELVSALSPVGGGSTRDIVAIFKRHKE